MCWHLTNTSRFEAPIEASFQTLQDVIREGGGKAV